MKKGKIYLEKNFKISMVDRRVFSSFLEHLGRAIYSGIYEPDHPLADEQGFRKDTLEAISELGVSYVRYPGGNFVSGYNWTDGIGPKEDRPKRLDYAWKTIEPNTFGIDEFVDWSKKANTEVMAAVNMGTGSIQDAGYMVEYCNYPSGTYWSDLRIKNGHKEPHNIKIWCVGNEMDGDWQTGHLDAVDYGKKAREAGKIMKWVDPSIELVMCGSSSAGIPTYPEYDRIVLEECYDVMDYLSLHMYFQDKGNRNDFLASFTQMDDFIKTIASTCDYVKALKRSKKDIQLSFDEWNVWYLDPENMDKRTDFFDDPEMRNPEQVMDYYTKEPHILEDNYTMGDALSFAGLLMSLLNNSDRVKIACLAQLVNAIAPIITKEGKEVIKQTTYYPFRDISKYSKGRVLKPVTNFDSLKISTGETEEVYTTVIDNFEDREVVLYALNICDDDYNIALDLRSFGEVEMIEHITLHDDDLKASNTFKDPDRIQSKNLETVKGKFSEGEVKISKLSFDILRFKY